MTSISEPLSSQDLHTAENVYYDEYSLPYQEGNSVLRLNASASNMAETVTQFTSDFWVTLLAGFLILLFYRYCVAPFTFFRRLGIRGPTPLPLLGNSGRILLDQNIAPKLHREWCSMYGRVFGMYFFRQPFLMMADPEMIRDVLVKEFPKFHDRKNSLKFRKPYDKMMAIVGGKKWKDIRSTLSPTFSAAKMKQMMALMNEAVGTLMQKGDKISRTGEIVDIYRSRTFFHTTVLAELIVY